MVCRGDSVYYSTSVSTQAAKLGLRASSHERNRFAVARCPSRPNPLLPRNLSADDGSCSPRSKAYKVSLTPCVGEGTKRVEARVAWMRNPLDAVIPAK